MHSLQNMKSFDDSGNSTDDEKSNTSENGPKMIPPGIVRSASEIILPRRTSFHAHIKDPNFNIVQRIQKKLSDEKISAIKEDLVKRETRIIDGVAVTTSLSTVKNNAVSPGTPVPSGDELPNTVTIEDQVSF